MMTVGYKGVLYFKRLVEYGIDVMESAWWLHQFIFPVHIILAHKKQHSRRPRPRANSVGKWETGVLLIHLNGAQKHPSQAEFIDLFPWMLNHSLIISLVFPIHHGQPHRE